MSAKEAKEELEGLIYLREKFLISEIDFDDGAKKILRSLDLPVPKTIRFFLELDTGRTLWVSKEEV